MLMLSVNKKPPECFSQAGFSLIELSIALTIIGIFMVGFLHLQKLQMSGKTMNETKANIDEINMAVSVYASRYGRLPCPASLTAKKEDETYGFAPDCRNVLSSSSIMADAGHIITEGRDGEKVVIGKIPYRELNVPEKSSRDGWGKDFYYAVSGRLTDTESYDQFKGAINVVDAHDRPLTELNVGAQYVIFSTGSDSAPPASEECDRERADGENCNGDGTFRAMDLSLGKTKDFYDDILYYTAWVPPVQNATGQCNILHQLLSYPDVTLADIQESLGEDRQLSLYPGEMTFLCNRRLLQKMDMKNCVLFSCRSDNVLQVVETIN